MCMTNLDHALEYAESGYSIFPIEPDTKRPLVKWREFQNRIASEEEITKWWTMWPDALIAMATGSLSGFVVVDCDNETALNAALALGFGSPCRVKTRRGTHLYWKHPQDGEHHGNHQGGNPGSDWPPISGLDFRGDGGYVLIPPSRGYEWSLELDLDDAPTWKRWSAAGYEAPTKPERDDPARFTFENLDLTPIQITKYDMMSEWDRAAQHIRDNDFPDGKIPTGQGNGRNQRVFRYASEQIKLGFFGPELRLKARAFMSAFFVDPLPDREFEDTIASVETLERRNHPDRFDDKGNLIVVRGDVAVEREERKTSPRRLILAKDAEDLIAAGKGQTFLIEPLLRPASILQVHGYSGSGKTLYLQGATYALAAGAAEYGPYEIPRPARVLYMDFEMGQTDLGDRLLKNKQMFGDAGDRFMVWTPWLDEGQNLNFNNPSDVNALFDWVRWARPEVVVIDTIRTAWSGLEENDAKSWAGINALALKLRNSGMAVVMLHHSNKPGDDGLGREAGSSNQLTVLETQMRVAQIYRDKETAKMSAGIWDGQYLDEDGRGSKMDLLQNELPANFFLSMALELRYGKLRSRTPLHDQVQYMGWGTHIHTGEQIIVSSSGPKKRARKMFAAGVDPIDIAMQLQRTLDDVREWVGVTPPQDYTF